MIKKRILFVCMGNICRSPAAEAIMKYKIKARNLFGKIEVDSAGTIDYHIGETADKRMIKHAAKRGYKLNSIARQFDASTDFSNFDYIVTMDNENYDDVLSLTVNSENKNKIFRMVDFCEHLSAENIPDPYYNGASGFEEVLDLLEDTANGLLKKVMNDINQ